MLELSDYIIIFLLGSVGGFLSGFLGVGGGIIYIPILDYFLSKLGVQGDLLVKCILANSLFTIIFSGLVASYKQYRMGNFFPREILLTALPGIVSALLMTWLIKNGTWYSKPMFNYVFAIMLFLIIIKMFFTKTGTQEQNDEAKPIAYQATGFFAGIITAMSGLGGGVVMTPVFTDLLKQSIRKASSVSNGVIPLFAITMGIYNLATPSSVRLSEWQIGYIILPLVLPMIVATFIFAPQGVRAAQRTPPQVIRLVFGTFVALVFSKLIYEIFAA